MQQYQANLLAFATNSIFIETHATIPRQPFGFCHKSQGVIFLEL
jgi:hypothetical protein